MGWGWWRVARSVDVRLEMCCLRAAMLAAGYDLLLDDSARALEALGFTRTPRRAVQASVHPAHPAAFRARPLVFHRRSLHHALVRVLVCASPRPMVGSGFKREQSQTTTGARPQAGACPHYTNLVHCIVHDRSVRAARGKKVHGHFVGEPSSPCSAPGPRHCGLVTLYA